MCVIYTYIICNITSGCRRKSIFLSTEVGHLSLQLDVRYFGGTVVNQDYKNAISIKLCVKNGIWKNKLRIKNLKQICFVLGCL